MRDADADADVSACVFLGPTLPLAEARAHLPGATFLPPAAQGDVYAACAGKPWALVIVDGVFDQRLAVWHKEILWALAQGIRVYGAASMGALRAAELAPFGMIGVGEVFRAFAGGALEDDDEVAVAVAASDGEGEGPRPHRATSEAMVNIRATLARAVAEGVVGAAEGEALVGVAKRLFYPERTFAAMLAATRAAGAAAVAPAALAALEAWLGPEPGRRARIVDQKRLDAVAALEQVRADARAADGRPHAPGFRFAYTEAWHEMRGTLEAARAPAPAVAGGAPGGGGGGDEDGDLLGAVRDVLARTAPAEHAEMWREAEERALAVALARAAGATVGADRLQAASEAFRRARALMSPAATHAWMQAEELDVERWSAMMEEDLLAGEGRRLVAEEETLRHLAALLRTRGRFGELASEARRLLDEARARRR